MVIGVMMVVVSFDSSGGLNLGGSRRRRRPRSLSRGRGWKVRLLLTRIEHDSRSGSCGRMLLDCVHGSGGARVLQVMLAGVVVMGVVVVHVGRRKVLELVVVMGSHC